MDKAWIPIGLCLALAGLTSFASVYMRLKTPAKIHGRLPPRPKHRGLEIFYQQVVFAALIVLIWTLGDFEPSDFGVSSYVSPIFAFLIGFVAYFLVLGVLESAARLFGVRDKLHDLSFEAMRFVWPRERMQKPLAVVAVCVLNPFTEEVIYRGVLVYYLGHQTGYIAAAVLIGLTLSVLAHAYQGLWMAPFHLLFHGTAIALLFSPLGLFGCFGMHFAGDLVPVVLFRKSMVRWRERRLAEKKRVGWRNERVKGQN